MSSGCTSLAGLAWATSCHLAGGGQTPQGALRQTTGMGVEVMSKDTPMHFYKKLVLISSSQIKSSSTPECGFHTTWSHNIFLALGLDYSQVLDQVSALGLCLGLTFPWLPCTSWSVHVTSFDPYEKPTRQVSFPHFLGEKTEMQERLSDTIKVT